MDRRSAGENAAAQAAIAASAFHSKIRTRAVRFSNRSARAEKLYSPARGRSLREPRRDRSVRVASRDYAGTSSPAPPQGIWFGNYCFTEPEILPCSAHGCNSGVYAILVRDPACYPRMLRAIYFGESGNVSDAPHSLAREICGVVQRGWRRDRPLRGLSAHGTFDAGGSRRPSLQSHRAISTRVQRACGTAVSAASMMLSSGA